MSMAEKRYLNFLANAIADMTEKEKQYLWGKIQTKSDEYFGNDMEKPKISGNEQKQ